MKKVALITGTSAGMGKEIAKQLFTDGYIVYGAARRVDKMEDIRALGIKVLPMDVADDVSIVSSINTIINTEGRIDVLINNAGFGSYGTIEEVPIDTARYQLEVNVFGAARLIQLVLPYMRAQHSGKIINITSIGGKLATPLGGWYHASKFALEGLSDSLRNEVKPFGIDVIVIEPGGIKTEWGSIATDNLKKISGNSAYKTLISKFDAAMSKAEKNGSEPKVIVDLVTKALNAKNPKARYSGGYMARPSLFMRKLLSDKAFDKMMMSQFK